MRSGNETPPFPEPEPATAVLSAHAVEGLRVAATLGHCVPGLQVLLRHRGTTVVEVRRPAEGVPPAGGGAPGGVGPLLVSPCGFRGAVAAARSRVDEGVALVLRGVDGDPEIELGLPPGGQSFPGGILRVPCADRWLFVAALCGDASFFAPFVPEIVAGVGRRPQGRLGLRSDDRLGTSVCFIEADGAAPPEDGPAVEVLGALLARLTAEQICLLAPVV